MAEVAGDSAAWGVGHGGGAPIGALGTPGECASGSCLKEWGVTSRPTRAQVLDDGFADSAGAGRVLPGDQPAVFADVGIEGLVGQRVLRAVLFELVEVRQLAEPQAGSHTDLLRRGSTCRSPLR